MNWEIGISTFHSTWKRINSRVLLMEENGKLLEETRSLSCVIISRKVGKSESVWSCHKPISLRWHDWILIVEEGGRIVEKCRWEGILGMKHICSLEEWMKNEILKLWISCIKNPSLSRNCRHRSFRSRRLPLLKKDKSTHNERNFVTKIFFWESLS